MTWNGPDDVFSGWDEANRRAVVDSLVRRGLLVKPS